MAVQAKASIDERFLTVIEVAERLKVKRRDRAASIPQRAWRPRDLLPPTRSPCLPDAAYSGERVSASPDATHEGSVVGTPLAPLGPDVN